MSFFFLFFLFFFLFFFGGGCRFLVFLFHYCVCYFDPVREFLIYLDSSINGFSLIVLVYEFVHLSIYETAEEQTIYYQAI